MNTFYYNVLTYVIIAIKCQICPLDDAQYNSIN
jgi:hypothetical protein